MTSIVGMSTLVEVSGDDLPAVPISRLTRADPAVATSALAHGLAAGAVGRFVASHVSEIDGQAALVAQPQATSWVCEQLDTSRMRQFPLGLAFVPVGSWLPLFEVSRFACQEREAQSYDASTIEMRRQRLRAGAPQAAIANFDVAPQTRVSEGFLRLQRARSAGVACVFRVTLRDGSVVVFCGDPTKLPGIDVTAGALARGDFAVLVCGAVIRQLETAADTYIEIAMGDAVAELEI